MHLIQTKYVDGDYDAFWFEYLQYSFDGWLYKHMTLTHYEGSYASNLCAFPYETPVEYL